MMDDRGLERKARSAAERKLQRIIDREGDLGGERRKPYYLEMLVSEAETAICLGICTTALMEVKNAPVPTKETGAAGSWHKCNCPP